MKTKSNKQAAPAKKNATPKKQDHAKKNAKKTECHGFISFLADVLAAIVEPLGYDGVVRVFTIRRSSSKPAPSVPTADRIKIAPSVKKQCKEALKKAKPQAASGWRASAPENVKAASSRRPAPLFTADEQKKILDLRKKGLSIKKVAKAIKRGDHAVAAFLKPAK